jgi:hypothetical protein
MNSLFTKQNLSNTFYAALLILFGFASNISSAQSTPNLFYNNGDVVYVQSGAVLHVQGDVVNAAGGGSAFTNNGLLNVEGDLTNNGTFKTDVSVGEGTVRLVGNSSMAGSATSGTQTISGTFSTPGTGSFYNLVVDRGAVGQVVALGSNVTVTGSLVWGGSNTADTYTPSSFASTLGNSTLMKVRGVTPGGNGIIQTYIGTTDRELYVSNGHVTAIAGYKTPTWSTAVNTEDQSVRTRGAKGVGNGGLSREVWQTGSYYVYPISTAAHTYNPIKFKFSAVASTSSNKIRGLFCDATGSIGSISQSISGNSNFTGIPHPPTTSQLDNNGYNIYANNPCSPGHRNWITFDNLPSNGGYWSFDGNASNTYVVEIYPNDMTFSAAGIPDNNVRAIKYHNGAAGVSDIAFDPTSVDWSTQIENVQTVPGDIYSYTAYTSGPHTAACSGNYTTGIPGGVYSGFSHFQAAGALTVNNNGNLLPVKLIGLTADPIENSYIRVSWATASEQDNKGFEVMRSADGINFTNIGWVDGNGSTNEQHNYSYNDKTVQPNIVYYYKLNQVDVDGRGTQTYVVDAEITDGPNITVSDLIPNPTTGRTRLVVNTTESQAVNVKFYDILGKLVMNSDDQVAYGTNTIDFDMSSLADATYTAIIKVGGNVYSKKIVLLSK